MGYYKVSKEKLMDIKKQLSFIKESTNVKMKHASMRALLKDYAKYLKNNEGYSYSETTTEMNQLIDIATSFGYGTTKTNNTISSFLQNLYFNNNSVSNLHLNTVMEILDEVSPTELPDNIQEEAREIVEKHEQDDATDNKSIAINTSYSTADGEVTVDVDSELTEDTLQDDLDEVRVTNEGAAWENIKHKFKKIFKIDNISKLNKYASGINGNDIPKNLMIPDPDKLEKLVTEISDISKELAVIKKMTTYTQVESARYKTLEQLSYVVDDHIKRIETATTNVTMRAMTGGDVKKIIEITNKIYKTFESVNNVSKQVKDENITTLPKVMNGIKIGAVVIVVITGFASALYGIAINEMRDYDVDEFTNRLPKIYKNISNTSTFIAITLLVGLVAALIGKAVEKLPMHEFLDAMKAIGRLKPSINKASDILVDASNKYVSVFKQLSKSVSHESFSNAELSLMQSVGYYYSNQCMDILKSKLNPKFLNQF